MVDMGKDLAFNTVKALIEPNVHWTAVAEIITGPCGFEIEDPVGSIDTASEGDDDTLVLWWVADIPVNAIAIVVDYLGILKLDSLAVVACPLLDKLLWIVSYGWEVGEPRG